MKTQTFDELLDETLAMLSKDELSVLREMAFKDGLTLHQEATEALMQGINKYRYEKR
jgi:hypothetical protein